MTFNFYKLDPIAFGALILAVLTGIGTIIGYILKKNNKKIITISKNEQHKHDINLFKEFLKDLP